MSTTTTALDLDAIEARANAATEGPWTAYPDGFVWTKQPILGDPVSGSVELADAQFIAAARQDVPALVAEVRRLRAALGQIADMCDCRRGDLCASAVAHRALHGPDADA